MFLVLWDWVLIFFIICFLLFLNLNILMFILSVFFFVLLNILFRLFLLRERILLFDRLSLKLLDISLGV